MINLLVNDFSYNNFHFKDMDVCMQKDCMKATINLKNHLRKHLYDGDIKEDEFLDLFLHSHAKKLQLCLNPTITKSELDSALKKGNKDEHHNALRRLFVERGITVGYFLNDFFWKIQNI